MKSLQKFYSFISASSKNVLKTFISLSCRHFVFLKICGLCTLERVHSLKMMCFEVNRVSTKLPLFSWRIHLSVFRFSFVSPFLPLCLSPSPSPRCSHFIFWVLIKANSVIMIIVMIIYIRVRMLMH